MYTIKDDFTYAQDICNKKAIALSKFMKEISDDAWYISKKWNSRTKDPIDEEFYLVSGKKVYTNDDIQNTFNWLLYKAQKSSCSYQGRKKAKLFTYIYSVLNGQYTKNDWLKYKYGNTSYIPKCILDLDEVYHDIYISLKRGKDETIISNELDTSVLEIQFKIDLIRCTLFKNGKYTPGKNPITKDEEDIDNIPATNIDDPARLADFKKIFDLITKAFDALPNSSQRIIKLYWQKGIKPDQIIEFINSHKQLIINKELKIKNKKDLYSYVTKVSNDLDRWIKTNNNKLYTDYNLNATKIRGAIKVILKFFNIK